MANNNELDEELDDFDRLFGKVFKKLDSMDEELAEKTLEELDKKVREAEETIDIENPETPDKGPFSGVVSSVVEDFFNKMMNGKGSDIDFFGVKSPSKQNPDDPDFIDITVNE